jgi:Spy/CpxP family protein refolding chaperone
MSPFILSSVLGILVVAGPQDGEGPKKSPHGFMCKVLECTETQAQQIEAIHRELRSDTADEREEIQEIRAALATEFAKPKLDRAEVTRLHDNLMAVRVEIAKQRLESKIQTHAVLTAEQRAKLAERMRNGRKGGKMKGHRGKKG